MDEPVKVLQRAGAAVERGRAGHGAFTRGDAVRAARVGGTAVKGTVA
jgi:hypothetical protein